MQVSKLLFILFISFFFLFFSPYKVLSQEAKIEFRWIEYLFNRGETTLAIHEGHKFLFLFPEHMLTDNVQILIGKSYFKENKYDKAIETFQRLSEGTGKEDIRQKADLWICNILFKKGDYQNAYKRCKEFQTTYPYSPLKDRAWYIRGWSLLNEWKWEASEKEFKEIDFQSEFFESAQQIIKETEYLRNLKVKSPVAAGIFSTILPGAGYIYVGKWRTGITAFLLNGALISSSIECFDNDLPILGGIIGLFEMGWYSGTIYGSVNSARQYNYKLKNDKTQALSQKFAIELLRLEF